GEIETALTHHPHVTTATVLLREDSGVPRLVAYITGTADPVALRASLAGELPDYMVPAVIVALEELPTNVNGKLDRAALPAPETSSVTLSRGPRNAREEIVGGILAAMLGLDSIGMEDDFFRLGGHSLLATRAVSRLRTALGAACSVRDVFEARTAAALAARLGGESAVERPALTAGVRPERLPLSYAQRRLWLIDSVRGPGTAYNVPFAVRLRGALDVPALEAAVHDVITRHEVLRTLFAEHEGEPYQRVLRPEEARV
ncbi:condensation domain-containing protein, partial [Streptomyces inusitatus]|uniref:condensation domain-containing protein n=1 Tax=Streptomyces inusitatus TaxID=68221 RepID=UPI001E2E1E27